MVLAVAAILAYQRSKSKEEVEENLDWKERLVKDLQELRQATFGRCYQPKEAMGEEEESPDGSDHAEPWEDGLSPKEAQHMIDQPVPSPATATTFRRDVRNEWINALFGPDFLQTMEGKVSDGPQKGMGLAKVAPFVAYQTHLPGLPPTAPATEKLGVSIARLALGLYVREVQPGSEAWCAGVVPNSVLVSINGMSLLAEPSKQALERVWQYEGYVYSESDPSNSNPSTFPPARSQTRGSKSAPPAATASDSLSIQRPIRMELIRHGKLYSVVLLANPPYGIDWGPCGNFALVKKTSSHGERAGIRKGSIIAKIAGGSGVSQTDMDLHEVDHTLAATLLRNLFEKRRDIRLTLCIPPSEARTGHFERMQDAKDTKHQNAASLPPGSKLSRPDVVAELDGVEVRVHPFLFLSSRSLSASNGGGSSSRELQSDNRASTKSSMLSAAATSLSHLAFRVAAGELFSLAHHRRKYYSSQRLYRPCPPMDQSLEESWSLDEALSFLLHYKKANYDVHQTIVAGSSLQKQLPIATNGDKVVNFVRSESRDRLAGAIDAFLLQILATIHTGGPHTEELAQYLVDYATQIGNVDAAYRIELVAQALGLVSLKESLASFRHTGIEVPSVGRKRNPRQIPIRVEQAPDEDSPATRNFRVRSQSTELTTLTPTTDVDGGASVSSDPPIERRRKFGFFRRKKKQSSQTTSPKRNRARTKGPRSDPKAESREASTRTPRVTIAKTIMDSRPLKEPLFLNTLSFIEELEGVCREIEKSLLRSISQKIAGWALQPWSPSKETELAQVTQVMRERLQQCQTLPILNPIDSQPLISIDAEGCYILPSAHFPLLLTFNYLEDGASGPLQQGDRSTPSPSVTNTVFGEEQLYRTRVELLTLDGSALEPNENGRVFSVQGSVGGSIVGSGPSIGTNRSSDRHVWDHDNLLIFDVRSSWGPPKTLSLRITEGSDQIVGADENGMLEYEKEIGYCFVNIEPLWEGFSNDGKAVVTRSFTSMVWSSQSMNHFDDHGDLREDCSKFAPEGIAIQIKVTVQEMPLASGRKLVRSKRRSLLYKHDDDVRQEMFAIEFIKSCESILKACGLDLRLLTFGCIPVGEHRGFIEWVNGSVPLSEICQPFAGSILDGPKKDAPRSTTPNSIDSTEDDPLSSVAKAGLTKYESLRRFKTGSSSRKKSSQNESSTVNPIQDFLRAFAFEAKDPFMIQKSIMENYVKSCAGYCVITYILGVGDRHLDNLLLHPTGHFFHCDYSFILGNDPKKHLPLRITQDMVNGMGGPKSDNYAMFLSLTCAAFLTLRRPENVRHLLSFVRLMGGCSLPDIGVQQSPDIAMMGLRDRMQLHLTDEEAISFMEKLIEESCSSRMWIAVDAIHTLGKRF